MATNALSIPWSGSGEKIWHQDNGYFRLTPCKVLVSHTHICCFPTLCLVTCKDLPHRESGLRWIQLTVQMDGRLPLFPMKPLLLLHHWYITYTSLFLRFL